MYSTTVKNKFLFLFQKNIYISEIEEFEALLNPGISDIWSLRGNFIVEKFYKVIIHRTEKTL